MRTARRLLSVLAVAAALCAVGAVSASALTYAGAAERSTYLATQWWGGGEVFQYCTGPYENVRGKTQYACYGYNQNYCLHWQINLDPYGSVTYQTHGCPAVRTNGAPGASGPSQ
jgi:hypothetical protein